MSTETNRTKLEALATEIAGLNMTANRLTESAKKALDLSHQAKELMECTTGNARNAARDAHNSLWFSWQEMAAELTAVRSQIEKRMEEYTAATL